jgi:hypothetical protein
VNELESRVKAEKEEREREEREEEERRERERALEKEEEERRERRERREEEKREEEERGRRLREREESLAKELEEHKQARLRHAERTWAASARTLQAAALRYIAGSRIMDQSDGARRLQAVFRRSDGAMQLRVLRASACAGQAFVRRAGAMRAMNAGDEATRFILTRVLGDRDAQMTWPNRAVRRAASLYLADAVNSMLVRRRFQSAVSAATALQARSARTQLMVGSHSFTIISSLQICLVDVHCPPPPTCTPSRWCAYLCGCLVDVHSSGTY